MDLTKLIDTVCVTVAELQIMVTIKYCNRKIVQ